MIGNYVYMPEDASNLCLFRRETSWLPAGIIKETKGNVALIKLFPCGQSRFNTETVKVKLAELASLEGTKETW